MIIAEKLKISIDIGASYIRICVGNSQNIGITHYKKSFTYYKKVRDEVDGNITIPLLQILKRISSHSCLHSVIGVSLAANFDRNTGQITSWPNHPKWNGFPLKEYLERSLGKQVLLEDDANAAAWGEFVLGAGKGHESMIYVTLSTGIGAGIIYRNQLFVGNGKAGELGHYTVHGNQLLCSCGKIGCLQTVASGRALERAYQSYRNTQALSLFQISELAIKGDKRAAGLFKRAGEWIAEALENMLMILDIPVFVIGGGVSKTGYLIMEPIFNRFKSSSVVVKFAVLGDNSGLYGMLHLPSDGGKREKTD